MSLLKFLLEGQWISDNLAPKNLKMEEGSVIERLTRTNSKALQQFGHSFHVCPFSESFSIFKIVFYNVMFNVLTL